MKKGVLLFLFLSILLVPFSASVPDADLDGVPDANDNCPNSDSTVVDQFGCTCEQKNCITDDNPCTDDCGIVRGLPSCGTFYNKNTCPGGYCVNGKCELLVSEKVTCKSNGAISLFVDCASDKGRCSGFGKCTVSVSGVKNEKIKWTNKCGALYTTVDGIDETINFICLPNPFPLPPNYNSVKEKVKCIFKGTEVTGDAESCYFENYGCRGIGSCIAEIEYEKWARIDWTSSCGGHFITVMDEEDEDAEFTCPVPEAEYVRESIVCSFKDAKKRESCESDKGGCASDYECKTDIKGKKDQVIDWYSTCSQDSISTTMDGEDESIQFECSDEITEEDPNSATSKLEELVKCIFNGSDKAEECYSYKGSCNGVGNCDISVEGDSGEQVEFTSSCDSNSILATIDGADEDITFDCTSLAIPEEETPQEKDSGIIEQIGNWIGSIFDI